MIEIISSYGFSPVQWLLLLSAAALIGANKAGLVSISLISIPVMALIFGGKASTGVMLPMLVAADTLAVLSYRKSIRWRELAALLPWTLAGIAAALYVGKRVPDTVFKIIIAAAILIVLIFLLIKEIAGKDIKIESRWYTNAAIGVVGGFSTMIGNAAGPVVAVYFLSLDLNKDEFISTRAWFFWLVNLIKVPLHLFVWKTITPQSLTLNLVMIPGILVGVAAGVMLVKRIPDKPYRIFVLCATFVASIFLII